MFLLPNHTIFSLNRIEKRRRRRRKRRRYFPNGNRKRKQKKGKGKNYRRGKFVQSGRSQVLPACLLLKIYSDLVLSTFAAVYGLSIVIYCVTVLIQRGNDLNLNEKKNDSSKLNRRSILSRVKLQQFRYFQGVWVKPAAENRRGRLK